MPAKKKKLSPTSKVHYAFSTDDHRFWDGKVRRKSRHGWKQFDWTPTFVAEPVFFPNEKKAGILWLDYELERQCGVVLPPLKVKQYQMEPVEVGASTFVLPFTDIVLRRLEQQMGKADVYWAFKKVIEQLGGDEEAIREYRFAIRRRGKSKDIIEETFPTAISYGMATFLKNETDLVYSRMVLGATLSEHVEMDAIYELTPS